MAGYILEGRYIYPEVFDQATKELCEECALIRKIIPKNLAKIKMTKEYYRAHWKHAKEETSSSFSGLHFGHYIAGIESITSPTSTPSKLLFSSTTNLSSSTGHRDSW
jgi:hypothetical protein